MLKRTWCFLLLVALVAAPATAFAAGPDRGTLDRGPSFIEQIWDGLLRLLDLDGDDFRERIREPERPLSVSGADDSGGGYDPDG